MSSKKLTEKNLKAKILNGFLLLLCFLAIGFAIFQVTQLPFQPLLAVTISSVIFAFITVSYLFYRLYHQKLEQNLKEIRHASEVHLATVEALALAIDARDHGEVGHIRRTQIYAVGIGKKLGLSKSELQALKTAALLHDIGKLAVPDHILNKPSRLTPAEMEKMKIHSSVGAAILEKIDFNYPVVETIRHHHESWDGSGYPDRLKGREIPLTARILAVADTYDTLRGSRPYQASFSREEARRLIINGAGTQFDPKIVDIFIRNLKVFEAQIEEEGLGYEIDKKSTDENQIYTDESITESYVEQIKRANREVFTLYELAKTFSSSLSLEEIYSLFVQKIRELVPFDTCIIYLFNEITDEAYSVYAEGENSSLFKNIYVKSGEGATGIALKKRQPIFSADASLDFFPNQIYLKKNYSAMASLPLIADEKLLGAVSIYSYSLKNYEDEHLRLMETVSHIASDVILKSISHAETESRALTDPMTGLPNARSLQIHFEKESARATRNGSRLQVLMFDLDGFKPVNDTFGHKVGDKMLKELAKVMRGQLRDYDFLARYAGDEFAAIIPETDNRSIKELCQRLEKAVNNFVLPVGDGRFAKVGVSIGTASYPQDGELLDQLLIAADKAMYEIKQKRKQKLSRTKQQSEKPASQPQRIPVKVIEPTIVSPEDIIVESTEENFVVELDESHIISSAIN